MDADEYFFLFPKEPFTDQQQYAVVVVCGNCVSAPVCFHIIFLHLCLLVGTQAFSSDSICVIADGFCVMIGKQVTLTHLPGLPI